MKITVITVCYNSADTLAETIDSVLDQPVEALEYIIVDGGSTDGTVDVVRRRAVVDERIRWVSEPDEGIADAFNKGLEMASGDWLGILNSDDVYAPGALQAVIDLASEQPDADIIHGDLVRLDEQGLPLFVLKPAELSAAVWHQMPINHPATFVSRRAYDCVGNFNKACRLAMDYDLVLRMYKAGCRFVYLDRVLAQMRYGGASDDNFFSGLKEVRSISMREGYPRYKADYWFCHRMVLEVSKRILRRTGLEALMKLHPRFRCAEKG